MSSAASQPTASARGRRAAVVLAALSIAGVCLALWVTRAAEQTGDSLTYAASARRGHPLFHPHHLIFNAVLRLLYVVSQWLGGPQDLILLGQIHNLFFLASGLVAIFWIGWRHLGDPGIALVGVLILASFNGLMVFATQVEVYVPAAACSTMAAAVLFDGKVKPRWKLFGVTLFWSLGVLYHQTGVLFAIPLVIWALTRRERGRFALSVMGLSGVLVLAFYLAVFLFAAPRFRNNIDSFWGFISWYLQKGDPTWGNHLDALGLMYLAENQWWALTDLPATAGSAWALAILVGGLAVLALRPSRARDLVAFGLGGFLAYGLLFWWWLPWEREFFILAAAPLGLAIFGAVHVGVSALGDRPLWRACVLTVLAVTSIAGFSRNLSGEIANRQEDRGRPYRVVRQLHDLAGDRCGILMRYQYVAASRYYFPMQVETFYVMSRVLQEATEGNLSRRLVQLRQGCLVFAVADILPSHASYLKRRFVPTEDWLRFILWLFEIGPCGPDGSVCGRSFRIVRQADGPPVFVLDDGEKSRFSGAAAFFDHLVERAEGPAPELSDELLKWRALWPDGPAPHADPIGR